MLEIDDFEKPKLLHEETTSKIIGAAFEVHAQLGYGFLERFRNGRNALTFNTKA